MADTPPRGGTGGHPSGTGIIVGVDSLGGTRPPSPGSPSGGEGSHHTAASASVPGKGHGEEDVTTGSSVCRHIVATGRLAASGTAMAHPSGNPPSPPEGELIRGRYSTCRVIEALSLVDGHPTRHNIQADRPPFSAYLPLSAEGEGVRGDARHGGHSTRTAQCAGLRASPPRTGGLQTKWHTSA